MVSKRKSPKLLIGGLYIVGLIVFVELSLRFAFPMPELSNFNRINYQPGINATKSDYLRNINMLWASSLDTATTFVHELNYYGFRDFPWKLEKPKGKQRILFVGDSFVEGMTSDGEQVITNGFLKTSEGSRDDLEVFNMGIMGVGINEFINLIVDAVPLFKPDHVFLVLCYNDIPFNRPYFPKSRINPEYFSSSKLRMSQLYDMVKAEEPLPSRFNFLSKKFYPAVPSPNNPWTYYEDSLRREVIPAVAEAMIAGDFNFFRTNWVLEEARFLRSSTDLSDKFKMLSEYVKLGNATFSVFYIPSRHQVSTYYYQFERQQCLHCPESMDLTQPAYQIHREIVARNCGDLGIPFYDLTPEFIQEEAKGNHLYWNYDDHMRGSSYMMAGAKMFNWWNGSSTSAN